MNEMLPPYPNFIFNSTNPSAAPGHEIIISHYQTLCDDS
jgi:hypothetical protein